ncbi:MAG: LytB protein [Gammaproteobacteria bacterium]|nr:LytB protein [Gammaproteobacteria bacterium]
METNSRYLEASFISFFIHAIIILFMLGFFYNENPERSIISKPINVNLIFEQKEIVSKDIIPISKTTNQVTNIKNELPAESIQNEISFDELTNASNIKDLINEDINILNQSDQNKIDMFSSLIISNIQNAWRKPINVQEGLICDMRLTINKNGRIVKVNLIKSSGNIRFDNSALKAVERVETFNFFDRIPQKLYQSDFKNILIKFNPS